MSISKPARRSFSLQATSRDGRIGTQRTGFALNIGWLRSVKGK